MREELKKCQCRGIMTEIDFDVLEEVFNEFSTTFGNMASTGIEKLLFKYRERKGITIGDCVDIYEKLYELYREGEVKFTCGGHVSPPTDAWLSRKKKAIKNAPPNPKYGFLTSRKFSYFVTRFHKIAKERWEERKRSSITSSSHSLAYPLYSLIKVGR